MDRRGSGTPRKARSPTLVLALFGILLFICAAAVLPSILHIHVPYLSVSSSAQASTGTRARTCRLARAWPCASLTVLCRHAVHVSTCAGVCRLNRRTARPEQVYKPLQTPQHRGQCTLALPTKHNLTKQSDSTARTKNTVSRPATAAEHWDRSRCQL